jgi:hypothetical protein
VINGRKCEIKFSTLWEDSIYAFQQIRDQDYEFAIMLGISPHAAHGWVASKAELHDHPTDVRAQHGGEAGRDTKWLRFRPEAPPTWLRPAAGDLAAFVEEARRVLSQSVR